MSTKEIKILFVCLGNICRSPLAEGIFQHLVTKEKLDHHFIIDSAGTGGYHNGEPYHRESQRVAKERGTPLAGRSRAVENFDFGEFHYLVAMDTQNARDLEGLSPDPQYNEKIILIRDYNRPPHNDGNSVPDPYFGGADGFDHVYDMLDDACQGFLEHLKSQHELV